MGWLKGWDGIEQFVIYVKQGGTKCEARRDKDGIKNRN